MSEVITIEKLNFSYGEQDVLNEISVNIKKNDFVAIIGPNGGGKSTLLKLILGLETPNNGILKVFGKTPKEARKMIGYVPQFGHFDRHFPMRVVDVVLSGLLKNDSIFPWFSKKEKKQAEIWLEKLKISHLKYKKFGELSGGQKQRTLIARALVNDAKLIILDEPTASVDSEIEKDIYQMLFDLNNDHTIILVSHDIAFVSAYVNKVMCLNKFGCVHDTGEITDKDLVALYQGSFHKLHHHCKI